MLVLKLGLSGLCVFLWLGGSERHNTLRRFSRDSISLAWRKIIESRSRVTCHP